MMRVRVAWTGWQGAPGLSTVYFTGAGATPTGPEVTEALSRVQAFLTAARPLFNGGINSVYQGQVDFLNDATGALTGGDTRPNGSNTVGSAVGSIAPVTAALVGQFSTAVVVNGRRVKGRLFLSPVANGMFDTVGRPTSTARSTVTTAISALGPPPIVTPITHVVWHRPSDAGPGVAVPVNGYSAWSEPSVLRSRRQ